MTAKPLTLITADNDFLLSRAVKRVAQDASRKNPDRQLHRLSASSCEPTDISEALSPSLFGGGAVVALTDLQDASDEVIKIVEQFVLHPDPDMIFIVGCLTGGRTANRTKKLLGQLTKTDMELQQVSTPGKHRELIEFVKQEFQAVKVSCDNYGAEALVSSVGSDIRELASVCGQLATDSPQGISQETVALYRQGKAEVSGFTVADAVIAGDTAGALEALRWALSIGVDPVPIADAIADGVRTVSRVASAGRGNAFYLAKSLGMPPWKIERAQRYCRAWTAERVYIAGGIVSRLNAEVKGASDSRGYALERAVRQLTGNT